MVDEIKVAMRVEVGGETKEFTATATTNGNPYRIAASLSQGVRDSAGKWLYQQTSRADDLPEYA